MMNPPTGIDCKQITWHDTVCRCTHTGCVPAQMSWRHRSTPWLRFDPLAWQSYLPKAICQKQNCSRRLAARAVAVPLPGAIVLAVTGRHWAPAYHVVVGKVVSANLMLVRDGPVETAQGHPLMCRFSRRAAAVSLASLPGTPSSSPARTAGGPCACFPLAYLSVARLGS